MAMTEAEARERASGMFSELCKHNVLCFAAHCGECRINVASATILSAYVKGQADGKGDWATGLCSRHCDPDPLCGVCNPEIAKREQELEKMRGWLADANQKWCLLDVDYEKLKQELAKARAEAEKYKRYPWEPLCLNCGQLEPCELKDDPNSPCTFDPTPRQLFDQNKSLRDRSGLCRLGDSNLDDLVAFVRAERKLQKQEDAKVMCFGCKHDLPFDVPSYHLAKNGDKFLCNAFTILEQKED